MQQAKQSLALLLLLFSLLTISSQLRAQEAFANEIKAFKKQDSLEAPPKNPILFVGSSSFRKWTDVQAAFPKYPILNRGFGGSTLPDVIYYAEDVIIPYHPKQVVIYCGENDAANDATTAQIIFERFEKLFAIIRKKLPKTPVAFVSMKPSPSRMKYQDKVIAANKLIKDYLAKQAKTAYIDVYPLMLVNGKPDESLFVSDMLHMNEKGYAIWQKAIQPYLVK
jgi:lysophospholipase L1-like esterase